MIKAIVFFVLGALLGGVATNYIGHRLAAPHRHPRAVMTLLGFHHSRLENAVKAANCADFDSERARLASLQQEIALAFPLTYKQEAEFRKHAEALGASLQSTGSAEPTAAAGAAAVPAACPGAAAQLKRVGDACDDCHRVYDPS